MNYKQLQSQLKAYRNQGYALQVKLNAKLEVLQAELTRVEQIKQQILNNRASKPNTSGKQLLERRNSNNEVMASSVDHKTYTGNPGYTQEQLRKSNLKNIQGNTSERHKYLTHKELYASSKARKAEQVVEPSVKVACKYTQSSSQKGTKANTVVKTNKFGLSSGGKQQYYNETNKVERPIYNASLFAA